MPQIKYNDASNILRFEYPIEWAGEDITGLTLTIIDKDGVELLAADAATLYTATELDGATLRFASQIVLDSGAGELFPGDYILIEGAAGFERVRVKGFDDTLKTAILEDKLNNAHDDADAVHGLWGVITVDTTDTDVFTVGLVATFIWTPAGSGKVVTESFQVSKSVMEIQGLEKDFKEIYPRAYAAFTQPYNRMDDMLRVAKRKVERDLRMNNLDMDRIVDQEELTDAIQAKMAYLWTVQGDEKLDDERKTLSREYAIEIGKVIALPIWADHNQDNVEDTGETIDHEHTFRRAW